LFGIGCFDPDDIRLRLFGTGAGNGFLDSGTKTAPGFPGAVSYWRLRIIQKMKKYLYIHEKYAMMHADGAVS
jgi:hypothetical protein